MMYQQHFRALSGVKTAGGFLLWNRGLQMLNVSTAGCFSSFNPKTPSSRLKGFGFVKPRIITLIGYSSSIL